MFGRGSASSCGVVAPVRQAVSTRARETRDAWRIVMVELAGECREAWHSMLEGAAADLSGSGQAVEVGRRGAEGGRGSRLGSAPHAAPAPEVIS